MPRRRPHQRGRPVLLDDQVEKTILDAVRAGTPYRYAVAAAGISHVNDELVDQVAVRLGQAAVLLDHAGPLIRRVPAQVLPLDEQALAPDELTHAQAVLARESQQALPRSERAVVVQYIGQHRGGLEAREARKVTAALRVAGALEHPAGFGAQWKDVPGLYQVARLRAAVNHGR